MDSTEVRCSASPPSPEVRISRPQYAAIPSRNSDDSSEARIHKRMESEEHAESGLGIQMLPVTSPKMPGMRPSTQDMGPAKSGEFASAYTPGKRPLLSRTPDTLYSFGSGIMRARSDPMTERLIAHRATQSAQWRVHWRVPSTMVFAFLMGVVFAILQHVLYTYLHHRRFENEAKKFRWVLYGRALAYLAKVAFGGCVVLVFRQRIWRTLRERALTVLSIDQLFGATEDPSLFMNWEAVSNAPVLIVIAMVIWLIPLATIIFSPGALTFGNFIGREEIPLNVPIIDFSAEENKDWRSPVKMADGSNRRSVMFYNTTDKAATTPGWFDYYDQPSAESTRIALLLAYSNLNHPNIKQDARISSCGGSWNCTYQQSFIGPGYDCEEVAKGFGDVGQLKELGAPFNMSMIAPEGRYVYYAEVDHGAYVRPQADFQKGPGGIPVGEIPEDLGVFKTEPVLWIGYAVNSTERLPEDDPLAKNWTHRYDPKIIRCVHKETKYTVKWEFIEPFFNSTVTQEYLAPIVDTNFTRWSNGTPNYAADPAPASNFISPRTDKALYKKTAAYHAMGDLFRDFVRGHVDIEAPLPGPYYVQVYSDITKTRLVEKNSEPKTNLESEIQSFYADMILSLFTAPEMLVVSAKETTVNRWRLQSSFVYVPKRLWECYAPVIFVTLLALLFGALTIWEDGTTFSTGFSRILVTTRNTTLDDISRGACLGNDPFPMELMHTKLKFGVLAEGAEVEYVGGEGYQSVGHCAFGVASEVRPVRRGALYAGLEKKTNLEVMAGEKLG